MSPRYESDQQFTSAGETVIEKYSLPPRDWYVRVTNDHLRQVSGAVYDASDEILMDIPTAPTWDICSTAAGLAALAQVGSALAQVGTETKGALLTLAV
eukprot:gene3124-3960_t